MNYLKLISDFEHRRKKVQMTIGQYWLDRLVEHVQTRVKDEVITTGSILAVLRNVHLERELVIPGLNIVTNGGDLYYAERAVGDLAAQLPIPTNFTDASGTFDGIMELYNGASAVPDKANDRSDLVTLVTGSDQVIDATYPQVNDGDGDNTGAGVDIATYRVSYATGDANGAGIDDVILTNPSPGASEILLMHSEFAAPFEKTSSDTLKVFVNHEFLGV